MIEVNVTELRRNLPTYLRQVRGGDALQVTSHGKVVARLVPCGDERERARERLVEMRGRCRIGDVTSPIGEEWGVEDGSS